MKNISQSQERLEIVSAECNPRNFRANLLALGAEISATLLKAGTLSQILTICTETIADYLDSANVCIWTLNQKENLLKLEAFAGCNIYNNNLPNWIDYNPEKIELIKQQLIPINCRNSLFSSRCYTLIVEEHIIGMMVIFGCLNFTEEDDILLGWIANNIALGMEGILCREHWVNRQETLLLHLARQLRKPLELNIILETVVEEIRNLLDIDKCHFLWCFNSGFNPRFTITHEAQEPKMPSLLGDFSAETVNTLLTQISNLEVIRIDNLAKNSVGDSELKTILNKLGINSILLLPFKSHSGQLGAIVCSHCNGYHAWRDSEVEFVKAVCDQVAIAIDQSEFYAQTRANALAAQTQAQHLSTALYKLQQTQAQLVQQEKMSSLGQLVAGVAHEINNPVNFINGNLIHANDYIQDLLNLLQLYQKHYPNPVLEIQQEIQEIDLEFLADDLPKLLSSMGMGAERIRQIVLSLRNFSRHDESEKKPVDIHEGIDNTLLILHTRLKANGHNPGIEVVKEYGKLPLVDCYAGQLNQVFMNIIGNAIDALDDKSAPRIIKISTELISASEKSNSVLIRISDNGSGINEDAKMRLFDPFFTTKPVGKGTGLGLSISYQIIVEKHHGTLKCISEIGKGSEFVIQIPVK